MLTRVLENRRFVEVLVKSHQRFEALRDFTIDSGKEDTYSARSSYDHQDDDLASLASESESGDTNGATPTLSERARGKQPINLDSTSSNSNLHSTNTTAQAPPPSFAFRPTPEWVRRHIPAAQTANSPLTVTQQLHTWQPFLDLHNILKTIDNGTSPHAATHPVAQPAAPTPAEHAQDPGERQQPRRVSFKWTPQALGWYLSVLWGLIYTADAAVNRGSTGVWAGTSIKLFSVVSHREQVSLRSPKGAVDAAGDAIARRITSFSFGGGAAASPTMREV